MTLLNKKAPGFTLLNAAEKEISLGDFAGKYLVLYFYPKDNTSGCTLEALNFTLLKNNFKKLGAEIIGISPDSCASHAKFIDRHDLGITLLSDMGHKVLEKYGVWQLKKMYGREYYGVERSTFLIDPQGKLMREWRKVKIKGHAEEVLATLQSLNKK